MRRRLRAPFKGALRDEPLPPRFPPWRRRWRGATSASCPSALRRCTTSGWRTSRTGASRGSCGGATAYPCGERRRGRAAQVAALAGPRSWPHRQPPSSLQQLKLAHLQRLAALLAARQAGWAVADMAALPGTPRAILRAPLDCPPPPHTCSCRYVFDSAEEAAAASSSDRYVVAKSEEEARAAAEQRYGGGVTLKQESDVLDTWFSSGLWPFSTLGWPAATPDLER